MAVRLGVCERLYRTFGVLQQVEFVVESPACEQLLMGACFPYGAFVQDDDPVGVLDGRKTGGKSNYQTQ